MKKTKKNTSKKKEQNKTLPNLNFKNLGIWEIGSTKMAVLFATLFLISFFDNFRYWIEEIHWGWFLAFAIVFSIKPIVAVLKK